jgi:hypothetical protein
MSVWFVLRSGPMKSRPRYSTQGAVGPVFGMGLPLPSSRTERESSKVCRSGGSARRSFGITACQTVMAGM